VNPHRGLLHHLILVVSDLARSSPFYGAMFRYLGYELGDRSDRFEDWKRWDLGTPHEISIVQAAPDARAVPHVRGAVGHHHHMAFCAADRADVDRFYAEVLAPFERRGLCAVEDAPGECPEYGDGYYATFFADPDGLKFEFVVNEAWRRQQAGRASRAALRRPPRPGLTPPSPAPSAPARRVP
jgi:catechol 2,3-dioxygenase-like lactoylglutathione lyase family enzyme